MEKDNSSNSSVCRKIREALANNSAFRAIHGISSHHQQPKPVTTGSNSPSPSPTNTEIQTKPPLPQHHKVNIELMEGSREIPIKFDDSSPTTMENGKHGHAEKVAKPVVGKSERETKVAAKGEPQPQHNRQRAKADDAFKRVHSEAPRGSLGAQHGHEERSEQQGKKSTDINDRFNQFIKRAKDKFRTMSNIGRGQNNPETDHEAHGTNKMENHKDHDVSKFIDQAKKKFRTKTIVGKTSH